MQDFDSNETVNQLVEAGKIDPADAIPLMQKFQAQQVEEKKPYPVIQAPVPANELDPSELNYDFNSGIVGSPEAPKFSDQFEPQKRELAAVAPNKIDLSEIAGVPQPAPQAAARVPAYDLNSSGLGGAYGMQERGAKELFDAKSKGLADQSTLMGQAADVAKQYDAQVAALQEQRKQAVQQHTQKLEAIQNQIEKEGQINPNRYWQDLSTGGKVTSLIAIMLSGIGGGLTGRGGNPALDIINKSIDNDILAQKDNFSRLKDKYSTQQSAYSLAMQELGNDQAATLAAKASALNAVEMKIKEAVLKSGSKEAAAQAQMALGQVQEEKAKLNMAFNMQMQKMVSSRQATMGAGVEDPSLLSKPENAVKMPNGLWKAASDPDSAKKMREIQLAGKNVEATLKQMKEIAGAALPFTTKASRANQLKSALSSQLLKLEGLGVPTGKDLEMVEALGVDPGSFRQDIVSAKMDALYDKMNANVSNAYQIYVPGYEPIQRGGARR